MRVAPTFAIPLLFSLAACAAPTDDGDPTGSSEDAVVGGTTTFDHPEVGRVWHGNSLCTGTLIRPDVVLTASHCVTGGPKDVDVSKLSPAYAFEIQTSATKSYRYAVDRAWSLPVASDFDGSQEWRAKDIAMLRLAVDVPSNIARPLKTATAWPWWGGHVALYGYGCTDRATGADGKRPGTNTKRKKEYSWSLDLVLGFWDTSNTCQGDSGGPLMDLDHGAILGITSGYVNGDDRFGEVPEHRDIIEAIADTWYPRH